MLKKLLSVFMAAAMLLSTFAVSMTSVNAEEPSQITGITGYAESEDPSRVMSAAVDGDTSTFWHTKFNSDEVNFENDINNSYYIDMGAEYVVGTFEYVPKQNANANGKINDFILYGTLDTDRETAQWTEIANVTGWTYGTAGEGTESHSVTIENPQSWRMLKITVKAAERTENDIYDFICAAEFKLYEGAVEAPVWEYEAVGDDSARITKYNGTDTNVVIPETIDGRTVSSIGAMSTSTSVFAEAYNSGVMIESVVMPDTVVLINQCAFRGIASLKTVTLSQNLTEIRTNAFLDCAALEKIDIPETVTDIGNNAFIGCGALKTIIIRGKNTYISDAGASAYTAAFGFMDIPQETKIEGITIVGLEGSKAQSYTNTYTHIDFMTISDYEYEEPIYMDCKKLGITFNAETGFGQEPWSYFAKNADGNSVELTVDKTDNDLSDGISMSDNASSTYRVGKYGMNTNPDSTGYTEIGYRFVTPYEGLLTMKFTNDVFGSNNGNAVEMYININGRSIPVETYTKETADREATAEDKEINSKWQYVYELSDFYLDNTQFAIGDTITLTAKMGGNYNKNIWITPVVNYYALSSKSMLQFYKDTYLDSIDISEDKRTEINEYMAGLPSADEITYAEAEEAVLTIDEIISRLLMGDVNNDGLVNINDVTLVQQLLAGFDIDIKNFNYDCADMNGDWRITILDATLIQIAIANSSANN